MEVKEKKKGIGLKSNPLKKLKELIIPNLYHGMLELHD